MLTEQWLAWLISSTYQSVLLFIIVGSLELFIGRWVWPQFRLLMWMLIPLHLLVSPQWYSPWTVWQWLPVESAQMTTVKTAMISNSVFVVVFFIWLAGCLTMLSILTVRQYRLRKQLLNSARSISSYSVYSKAAAIIGCKPVPLLLSERVHSPLVIGIVRPVILLPHNMFHSASEQDIELALCHELGHIKRRDHWLATFNMALICLAWFNPLVWFAVRRINILREFCCDALVMRKLGQSGAAYPKMLARAALSLDRPDNHLAAVQPGLALLNKTPAVMQRIKHLRGRLIGQRLWARAISFVLITGLALITLPSPPIIGASFLANPNAPGCLLTRYAILANLHQQQKD